MQNGSTSHSRRESVSDIKSVAKEQVQRASKGASPTSLLEIAKQQSLMASAKEGEGDIKGAYVALVKAGALMAMFMDSTEFKQDKAKRGVLTLGWQSFQQVRSVLQFFNFSVSRIPFLAARRTLFLNPAAVLWVL